jgi:hypothetical protein
LARVASRGTPKKSQLISLAHKESHNMSDVENLAKHFALPGTAPFVRHHVVAHLRAAGHTVETANAVCDCLTAAGALTDREPVSMPVSASALLARAGVDPTQTITVKQLDAHLAEKNLSVTDRFELKTVLRAAGALA